jgi:hypothetical protein
MTYEAALALVDDVKDACTEVEFIQTQVEDRDPRNRKTS